ncbi:uncharacterized protein LOC106064540 isoform X2 [Biomphalaria glabrata]|uniref:Uncharacterized protein LOC106064540 isoform X2 n=1 Tax=Biomphalaria glabrata TaxID=6526 RepID=A0A9W2ZEL6_BIOGL|nr:uncharacterized protein LOC106064540 isoform X2 [Biomphalaria glabrata]
MLVLTSAKSSLAPQIPRKWELGRFIEKGSFASVYMVKDPGHPEDEKFIVKEIPITKAKKDRQSNFSEIEILRSLNHIRIVPFYGSDERDNVLYIFMGYMKKGSLANLISSKQSLSEWETKIFTRQVLEGVSYLHHQKPPIIHRDIKGKNILLEDERNIKLTDFGLSKMINENTNARSSVGTYKWMAPEVVNITSVTNGSYDLKADIWSIGCTVVEMITGNPPFPKLTNFQALIKIGNGKQPEYDLPSNSSEELKDFLKKIFKVDPKQRPTSDDLLKHDFVVEQCLSSVIPKQWIKIKQVGIGTFGKVFLAQDPMNPQKEFAVKEISMRPVEREMIMQLFRNEEKILKNVNHQRIVKFYGFSESNNVLSICMSYMPMGSLEDYLGSRGQQKGFIPEDQAALYTRQLLEGVQYLHENNIIHKDITGKHILMESEISVKLGGISVSKTFRHDSQARTLLKDDSDIGCVGTVNWMAPELIKEVMNESGDNKYNNKVDIWSVGCTLVQMVTGSAPFQNLEPHQVVFKLITGHRPEYSLPDTASKSLIDFLKVTLEHNPDSRLSATQLLNTSTFLKEK